MNRYKFINILIASILITGTISCEDYLDVNTDPNNPTEVSPDLILPVAQHYTATYIHGNRMTNHLGNLLMYNWSEAHGFSWYNEEFQYLVSTTFYSQIFDNAYLQPLKQYQILTQLGPEFDNYAAIGKIMKAYHFQILVDTYGDIPYFDALGRRANASPTYDDAQAIYDDLILQLTEAINLINGAVDNPASVDPGADDVIFGGNMLQWKRFANTIKMRILVRESDVASSTYLSEQMAVIEQEGSGFITDDVVVDPGYQQEEGKQNPFWNTFGASVDETVTLTNDATAATQYIIEFLQDKDDPRIDYIYEEPETGHSGVNQGVRPKTAEEHSPDVLSNIGPGLLIGPDQGSVIFTLAESYFNRAEAALKGFGPGDPEALYYNGIEASFDLLGAPDFEDYISQNEENVNYDASPDKLEAIITQKWIAVNGITALQSWFDYNRTGYPENLPISLEASTNDRPVRLFYPASEKASNAANVPTQKNAFTDKVFWAN